MKELKEKHPKTNLGTTPLLVAANHEQLQVFKVIVQDMTDKKWPGFAVTLLA